MRVYVIFQKI